MPKNKLAKPLSLDEVKKSLLKSGTGFDALHILTKAKEELDGFKGATEVSPDSYLYKSMTLMEFDKGVLLMNAVPELYRVFALEFSRNLQDEYGCSTPSEKSLAEVAALNFVRTLELQKRIKSLTENGLSKIDIQYLAVLSQELDRAQRHYLTSLEAIRGLRNPSLGINIKAKTAVVGQNQIVQANNNPNNS